MGRIRLQKGEPAIMAERGCLSNGSCRPPGSGGHPQIGSRQLAQGFGLRIHPGLAAQQGRDFAGQRSGQCRVDEQQPDAAGQPADRKPQPRDLDGRASSRPRPSPRPAPHGDKLRDEIPRRPFKPAQGHGRTQSGGGAPKERGQWEERTPPQPPRPPRPEREPRPEAEPGPEPPPHPSEPVVPPTEPPERGGDK